MADAAGDDTYQDFIVSRTFQLEGLDLQRAPSGPKDCRPNIVGFRV